MKRYIKLVLYGEPGVGKSTFAFGAPKPFFICTDGNYNFLPNAKEEDHVVVSTWKQFKKVANQSFDGYETIVVDLLEDVSMFCEKDYCLENDISYVGDHDYGKGWRITKDNFFLEIAKLIAKDKNIILIMHESSYDTKNKRGNTMTKYCANYRIKSDIVDQIEGRVQYFLHCYGKEEEIDGRIVNVRYLSLIPKENEFGIARGVDERTTPSDIPLDWQSFVEATGFDAGTDEPAKIELPKKGGLDVGPKVEPKAEPKEEKKAEEPKPQQNGLDRLNALLAKKKQNEEPKAELKEEPKNETKVEEKKPEVIEHEAIEQPVNDVKQSDIVEQSDEDKKKSDKEAKLAAIRAKLGVK